MQLRLSPAGLTCDLEAPGGTVVITVTAEEWEIIQDEEADPGDVAWLDERLTELGVDDLPPPVLEPGVRIWIMKKSRS